MGIKAEKFGNLQDKTSSLGPCPALDFDSLEIKIIPFSSKGILYTIVKSSRLDDAFGHYGVPGGWCACEQLVIDRKVAKLSFWTLEFNMFVLINNDLCSLEWMLQHRRALFASITK
jgi:hypothetical protein